MTTNLQLRTSLTVNELLSASGREKNATNLIDKITFLLKNAPEGTRAPERDETKDEDDYTVFDILLFIGQLQEAEGFYECCREDSTAYQLLMVVAKLLCDAAACAYRSSLVYDGLTDGLIEFYTLLGVRLHELLDAYDAKLKTHWEEKGDPDQYYLRREDIPRMLRWSWGHSKEGIDVVQQMPAVTLVSRLLYLMDQKNPEYAIEFLCFLLWNMFGLYREV